MIIAISGTPGSGKTTLSKNLARKLDYVLIDVNDFIKNHPDVVSGFDPERDSKIIDTDKLAKVLKLHLKKNKITDAVIDSHLSHYFSKDFIDLVIIAHCDLKVLKKRLQYRKYHESKVKENLDCEIFDICKNEAIEAKHNILDVDCTKSVDIEKLVSEIKYFDR